MRIKIGNKRKEKRKVVGKESRIKRKGRSIGKGLVSECRSKCWKGKIDDEKKIEIEEKVMKEKRKIKIGRLNIMIVKRKGIEGEVKKMKIKKGKKVKDGEKGNKGLKGIDFKNEEIKVESDRRLGGKIKIKKERKMKRSI